MEHARNLLQKVMAVSGAQRMGMVAITLPALMLKSPEGRAHHMKEEKIGQSAAAGYTVSQRAAELAYLPMKG